METKCLNCGNPFEKKGGGEYNKTRKYCCFRCYNKHKSINQVKLICTHCKKEFYVSEKRSKEVTHCSRKCYVAHAATGGDRKCKQCSEIKPDREFAFHAKGKTIRRRVCIDCFNLKNQEKARKSKTRWKYLKNRCKKSDIVCDIPLDIFELLILQPCHYCGGSLNETGGGLDRKNNATGYENDNVVPCCRQCNRVKGHDFTYEEMLLIAKVLRQIRESKIANRK